MRFVFGPFELDQDRRRLIASGEPAAISERHLDILLTLVARAGQIVPKDDLVQAGWRDVAVGDNSLEQAISGLRRVLGPHHIDTVPRRGYKFVAEVARVAPRETDAGLEALLAPHRAFVEGRAALETLERSGVARAREVFEAALGTAPESPSVHVGLANACVMQFEMTRADAAPDAAALALAARHARDACRLDPQSGEAWATLGFVLDRTGDRLDAQAAAKRAVALEPDNWRHHFRAAFVSWGEERLRAARHTLALLPGFPMAHWLAATVYVARQLPNEAERELDAGVAAMTGDSRFGAVALHWLLGLVHLSRGDDARALGALERELATGRPGLLYARECAANTWYAIGAVKLRQGRTDEAHAAFAQGLDRVAGHPLARVALAGPAAAAAIPADAASVDAAMCRAAAQVLGGDHTSAARGVDAALAAAPPGNAAWLLPVEPLLQVSAHADDWAAPLARLRSRAA